MNTAFLDGINWIAVICATLAYFGLGALWYSKLLFVNAWIRLLNIDVNAADAKKDVGKIMGLSLVCMFLVCTALAVLCNKMDLTGSLSGFKLGLFTGCLFSVATMCINYLFEKKPFALYLINGGYALVGQIIASLIICTFN